MANQITNSTTTPTTITATDVSAEDLRVAYAMVETYLGKDMPIKLVAVTYSIDDLLAPLPAVENYPINSIVSVIDNNQLEQQYDFDDAYILPADDWRWSSNTITAQYRGGLPTQIFDAIMRQARMLKNRKDLSPEFTDPQIGDASFGKFNPMYRSALSPDVRGMLFPFREFGF